MESLNTLSLQFKTALAKHGGRCSLALARLVKVTVPNYLSKLPIPETYEGWSKLSSKDWKALIPPVAVVAGFSYITYCFFCPGDRPKPDPPAANSAYWEDEYRYNYLDDIYIDEMLRKAARCHCGAFQNEVNYNNSQQKTKKKGKQRKHKSKSENFEV